MFKNEEEYKKSIETNILPPPAAMGWLLHTKYKLGYPIVGKELDLWADCFGIVIDYILLTTGKKMPKGRSGSKINLSNYAQFYREDKAYVLDELLAYIKEFFIEMPASSRYFGDILWSFIKDKSNNTENSPDNWALGIDSGNGQMLTTSEDTGPIVVPTSLYNIINAYRFKL